MLGHGLTFGKRRLAAPTRALLVIAKSTEERDEATMTTENTPIPGTLNNVIRIDDEQIKGHLDFLVRGTWRKR